MLNERFKKIKEITGALHVEEHEDTIYAICPLAFHVMLLVEPGDVGGAEARYCYYNQDLAIKALEEFKTTGELKYWHKHHNKGISINCKNHAFPNGVLHEPENSIFQVDWDVSQLKIDYPYTLDLSNFT